MKKHHAKKVTASEISLSDDITLENDSHLSEEEQQLLQEAMEKMEEGITINPIMTYPEATKVILRNVSPKLLMQILGLSGSVFSAWMLAQLDSDGVPAWSIILLLQRPVTAFGIGLIGPMTGIDGGSAVREKNFERVGQVFRRQFAFNLLYSTGAILTFAFSDTIFQGFNLPLNPSIMATDYLRGFSIGMFQIYGTAIYQAISVVTGRPHFIYYSGIAQTALTALLGYFLTFGLGPIPALGAFGLGLSSSIASTAALLVFFTLFNTAQFSQYGLHSIKDKDFFAFLKFMRNALKKCSILGLQATSELAVVMAFPLIANNVTDVKNVLSGILENNTDELGAMNLFLQLYLITLIPLGNAGSTIGTVISKEALRNSKRLLLSSLMLAFGYGSIMMTVMLGANKELISLFVDLNNPKNLPLVTTASSLIFLGAFGQIPNSLRLIMLGGLQGFKQIIWPTVSNILIANVGTITTSAILTLSFEMGVQTIITTQDISLTLLLGTLALFLKRVFNGKKEEVNLLANLKKIKSFIKNPFTLFSSNENEIPLLLENSDSDEAQLPVHQRERKWCPPRDSACTIL